MTDVPCMTVETAMIVVLNRKVGTGHHLAMTVCIYIATYYKIQLIILATGW